MPTAMNKAGIAGPAEGVSVLSFLSLFIVDFRNRPVFEQIECTESLKRCVDDLSTAAGAKDWLMLDYDDGPALCFWGDPRHCCKIAWGLAERLRQHPPGAPLQTRIGINLGPVAVVRNGTSQPLISGEGIDLARAVAAAAEFSEVLATRTYVDVVAQVGVPGTRFAAIGTVSFEEKKYPIYRLEPDSSTIQPARSVEVTQAAASSAPAGRNKLSAAKASGSAATSTKRARFGSRTLHSIALPLLAVAATIGALGLFSRQNGEAVQRSSALSDKQQGTRDRARHPLPQRAPATPSPLSAAVETPRSSVVQRGPVEAAAAQHTHAAEAASQEASAASAGAAQGPTPEISPAVAAVTPTQPVERSVADDVTAKTQAAEAPAAAAPSDAATAQTQAAGASAETSPSDAATAHTQAAEAPRPDAVVPATPTLTPSPNAVATDETRAVEASGKDAVADPAQIAETARAAVETAHTDRAEASPNDAATARTQVAEAPSSAVMPQSPTLAPSPNAGATEGTAVAESGKDAAGVQGQVAGAARSANSTAPNPTAKPSPNETATVLSQALETARPEVPAPAAVASATAPSDSPTGQARVPETARPETSMAASAAATAPNDAAPAQTQAAEAQRLEPSVPPDLSAAPAADPAATPQTQAAETPPPDTLAAPAPASQSATTDAASQAQTAEEPRQEGTTPPNLASGIAANDAATTEMEAVEESGQQAAMPASPESPPAANDRAAGEAQTADGTQRGAAASDTLPTEDARRTNASPDAQPRAGSDANNPPLGKAAAGQRAAQLAARFSTGTLFLLVRPWGEVFVDGKRIGVTPPLKQLRLSTGKRVIEVRNRGLPAYARTLEIKARTTTTVNHNFN